MAPQFVLAWFFLSRVFHRREQDPIVLLQIKSSLSVHPQLFSGRFRCSGGFSLAFFVYEPDHASCARYRRSDGRYTQ